MHIKAKFLAIACAVVALGAVGVANAQTNDTGNVPGAQGQESVGKNLDRHPNDGLENAQRRIEDNIADREERKADKAAHAKDKDKAHHDKAMRAEKAERAEKVERPEKADRPERPDRPERAGRS